MEKLKFGEGAILEDGKEYICYGNIVDNGNDYVYLISNFKPVEIRYAKQAIVNGELQLEIIGNKELKLYLTNLFQEKLGSKFGINN